MNVRPSRSRRHVAAADDSAAPGRPTRRAGFVALAVLVVGAVPVVAGPVDARGASGASNEDDPALDQRLDVDQPLAEDDVVLDVGHVDLGPRFVDGDWRLLVHDDTGADGSVWRLPDRTVFHVRDAGRIEVPDDDTYAFLGADPGASVHLIPQVQLPEVVWLGWNTQDPTVMERIDRGVSLSLVGHEGPGQLTVYLQGGNFAEPDVLWSTADPEPSPIWVETNTHTHANWVFSEPGVHLLAIRADATLVGGEEVSDTAVVRVAVGDDVDLDDVVAATVPVGFTDDTGTVEDAAGAVAPGDASTDDGGTGTTLLVVLAAAVALLAAVGVVAWRSAAVRRSAT